MREGSSIHRALRDAALSSRCVFLAGLPGVGKTLMIQQLARIAGAEGRTIDLLQWDVARSAFEKPAILARYPEVDGVTNAAIRLGVGLWARAAVGAWDASHPDGRALLIGETPLIGNRLVELAKPTHDDVEQLLASDATTFLVPTPSAEVRAAITSARAHEMAVPQHERERANASSGLVDAAWLELQVVARQLDLTSLEPAGAFQPDLYAATYLHLLRYRKAARLGIDEVLPVEGSPYEMGPNVSDLRAEPDQVERLMRQVSEIPELELEASAASWFQF